VLNTISKKKKEKKRGRKQARERNLAASGGNRSFLPLMRGPSRALAPKAAPLAQLTGPAPRLVKATKPCAGRGL